MMKADEFVCPKCDNREGEWTDCDKTDTDGSWLHEDDCFTLSCDKCEWQEYDCEVSP